MEDEVKRSAKWFVLQIWKRSFFIFWFIFVVFLLSFAGITQALQQVQTPLQTSLYPRPPAEELSDFEQFISGIIEITNVQFEILKKYEEITFSYTSHPIPGGNIAVPIRIVEFPAEPQSFIERPPAVDAGYLIGAPKVIANAFKLLGIKSPFNVTNELKQFGYDFFKEPPLTFAPVDKIPVGPDYVIGPDDELRITIWGKVEGQWSVVVGRDGSIALPKVGIIGVVGLTFQELKEVLHREFSKYYSSFEMNVSMGALRTIRVYVVGNAKSPGAYTVSSLSTLINALFAAGGPNKVGTMRDIQLKRGSKDIVHLDMYDFLLKGDKTNDVRLMPEDVIFIPPIGPVAAIAGSVKNPAIYEIKGEKGIYQLIELSGGLNVIAFKGRVQVERISDDTRQIVSEYSLDEIKTGDVKLQAGDVVRIFQIIQDRRTVRVSGAVQREGEYGVKEGMTVRDLILMAGGLKYYAYKKEAELTRRYITDEGLRTEKFIINIEKALKGVQEANIPLKEDDYFFVRTIPEWQDYLKVTIQGEVKFPGIYLAKPGERLSSLIERVGSYTDNAYLKGAVFTRESVKELQQKGLGEMVLRLQRELLVESSTQTAAALSDLEIQAKKGELEQKQKFIQELKKLQAAGRITIRLSSISLLKESEYDIELEDGDVLYIPRINRVVNVMGSVMSQGSHIYSERLDYKDYIEMSGGYSRYADKGNVYLLKVDGSAKKHPDRFINWNSSETRLEIGTFGEEVKEIEPGDSIIVPEKLDRVAWLREVKDITQILMQMAVTTGVILQLF